MCIRDSYLAGLALCLQMQARYEEAIRIQSLIGVLYPLAPEATLRVAECQLALAQTEAARESLRLVVAAAEADSAYAPLGARAASLLALTAKEGHS